MEDKKIITEPIDIPKKNEEPMKNEEQSPSTGWLWAWGKPNEEKKIDLTPEKVKSQVTDPNVLHHIAAGERQQQLKQENEQETEEETDDEENSDFEEEERVMTQCEKLEEYGQEVGYALREFKRSVELDFKNVYTDLLNAPEHAKLFMGAACSVYLDIFPQAAIAFLTIMTVNGIVEAEVEKRLRQRIRKTVLVEDKNVCTSLDDVDSDSEKCVDCDGHADADADNEEKECV